MTTDPTRERIAIALEELVRIFGTAGAANDAQLQLHITDAGDTVSAESARDSAPAAEKPAAEPDLGDLEVFKCELKRVAHERLADAGLAALRGYIASCGYAMAAEVEPAERPGFLAAFAATLDERVRQAA